MSRTDHHNTPRSTPARRRALSDREAIAEQVAAMSADDWQVENQGAFGALTWTTWDTPQCECLRDPAVVTSESSGYPVPRHSVLVATQEVKPRRTVQHVHRRVRIAAPVFDAWREQTSRQQVSICQ